jgi:phosphinothricin acetyltransferase
MKEADGMNTVFVPLAEEHRTQFMDILNDYSEHSFAAYPETRMPYERFDLFLENAKSYPAYAAVETESGAVVGFFHLRPYNQLPTFRESCEWTVFFRKDCVGQGLGSKALRLLEEEARKHGVKNILASVVSRNETSLAFHLKNGFTEAGRLRGIGKKFGEYFDVVLMQKTLE